MARQLVSRGNLLFATGQSTRIWAGIQISVVLGHEYLRCRILERQPMRFASYLITRFSIGIGKWSSGDSSYTRYCGARHLSHHLASDIVVLGMFCIAANGAELGRNLGLHLRRSLAKSFSIQPNRIHHPHYKIRNLLTTIAAKHHQYSRSMVPFACDGLQVSIAGTDWLIRLFQHSQVPPPNALYLHRST